MKPLEEKPIILSGPRIHPGPRDACAFDNLDSERPGIVSLTCRCSKHSPR